MSYILRSDIFHLYTAHQSEQDGMLLSISDGVDGGWETDMTRSYTHGGGGVDDCISRFCAVQPQEQSLSVHQEMCQTPCRSKV